MKIVRRAFSLCVFFSLTNFAYAATEQQAFDEGSAFGSSQISSAMNTLQSFDKTSIPATAPDASSQAESAFTQSLNNNASVDNSIVNGGEAIASNAEQIVNESGAFCASGDCKDTHTTPSDDFDEGGSELSGVSSGAEDVKKEQQNVHVKNAQVAAMLPVTSFGGSSVTCSYDSVSFKNCCAQKGSGISIGLKCSSTERNLAKAVQEDRAIEVGIYCDKRVPLVGCVSHRKVYCQFGSLLDRIIQSDGRSRQLHIPFGPVDDDHHDANCRGLYPDEIDRVDFDQCDSNHPAPNCIDYTPYYAELEADMTVPAS